MTETILKRAIMVLAGMALGMTLYSCHAKAAQQDISGSLTVGSTYSSGYVAPTNGAIIQGVVGIGTAAPNANAVLDVTSTTKAFMPPRMSTTQVQAVATPTEGMMAFDTTVHKAVVYNGSAWLAVTATAY